MTAVGKVYLIKKQAVGGKNIMQTYADMTKEDAIFVAESVKEILG